MHTFIDPMTILPTLQSWTLLDGAELLKKTDIEHELDVFDARRGILELAQDAGFSKEQSYYLVTAITELGNNIVCHSHGGSIALQGICAYSGEQSNRKLIGLQILAKDKGPGIENIKLALQDGFTTANSMGCGLSGVERLMDELQIESDRSGTVVTSRIWLNGFRGLFCFR